MEFGILNAQASTTWSKCNILAWDDNWAPNLIVVVYKRSLSADSSMSKNGGIRYPT